MVRILLDILCILSRFMNFCVAKSIEIITHSTEIQNIGTVFMKHLQLTLTAGAKEAISYWSGRISGHF